MSPKTIPMQASAAGAHRRSVPLRDAKPTLAVALISSGLDLTTERYRRRRY
jgi:hypothetical protein